MMDNKKYNRDEYVYLAKLYERAERYVEMFKWISSFIKADPKLSTEERNILSAGFKNIIGSKRSSWRILQNLSKKEEKKNNSANLNSVEEIKSKLENEMRKICDDVHQILDEYLVPNAQNAEYKVFYLKLKGDYYRYRAEFSEGKEHEESIMKAEQVYRDAHNIAEKEIPISSSTRLGLALNYSVFFYEIQNKKEEACSLAKSAFEEAIKILDDLERTKAKDTILIIQLLKENLILWNNEMNEEES
jgi:14-3-3 protein epsilon